MKKWLYALSPLFLVSGSVLLGATVDKIGLIQMIAMLFLLTGAIILGMEININDKESTNVHLQK